MLFVQSVLFCLVLRMSVDAPNDIREILGKRED